MRFQTLAGERESVKGPAMRFVSSRPVLFLAASALALSLAAPALAQEAASESAPDAPSQDASAQDVETHTEPNGDPVPHIIIADEPETPEEPKITPIPVEWAPLPLDAHRNSAFGLYLAGRNALTSGESATGADYLARVFALTPEQPRVRDGGRQPRVQRHWRRRAQVRQHRAVRIRRREHHHRACASCQAGASERRGAWRIEVWRFDPGKGRRTCPPC